MALQRPYDAHRRDAIGEGKWAQRIDAAEIAAAPDGAPRRKFVTPAAMIAALEANGG